MKHRAILNRGCHIVLRDVPTKVIHVQRSLNSLFLAIVDKCTTWFVDMQIYITCWAILTESDIAEQPDKLLHC